MYELVIIQDVFEVDPLRFDYLSAFGRRFSIVRPHLDEVIDGSVDASYCAVARNEATKFAQEDWVVFLAEGSEPDRQWFDDLERDLEEADRLGAAASVAGDVDTGVTRASDIAYRRDVLSALGGFDENTETAGSEDFSFGLQLVVSGSHIVQGSRSCTSAEGLR